MSSVMGLPEGQGAGRRRQRLAASYVHLEEGGRAHRAVGQDCPIVKARCCHLTSRSSASMRAGSSPSAATAGPSSTSTGALRPLRHALHGPRYVDELRDLDVFNARGASSKDRPTAFEGRGTARSAARWPSRTRSAILTAPFLAFAICGRTSPSPSSRWSRHLEFRGTRSTVRLLMDGVRIHDVPLRRCADELLEICAQRTPSPPLPAAMANLLSSSLVAGRHHAEHVGHERV